jgi:lipopolysaccharide transport system ATP-binding protein
MSTYGDIFPVSGLRLKDSQMSSEAGYSSSVAGERPVARADDDVAIRVCNLSKCYHIYDRPQDRLKQSIVPRLQRLVGKPATQYAREFWALKDVSFEVRKGETVGIIGRNGSGKSTLLQMICGTLTPTSGTIQTNGRVAALLELGAGFNPEFTGRENVYMNGAVLGLGREEIDARFDDIAAYADIGEFIEQPVKTYSSGMHVRLAFAVAAHVDADILVIDEALSVGDFVFQQKCMRYLRGFMKTGTVLFVSHDTGAVSNLCGSAMWLDQGQNQAAGPSKDVCELYLEACYVAQQGESNVQRSREIRGNSTTVDLPKSDQRLAYINASSQRNDIEVFSFDPDAPSFGKSGATIESVQLLDVSGNALAWIVGGDTVVLVVHAAIHEPLSRAIIGFHIKDRLGQNIFGDNTYLTYVHDPVSTAVEDILEARFTFAMPLLPAGRYSVCAAIADGTQEDHVQHHWIHDALIFESKVSPLYPGGLVGIPMFDIQLSRQSPGSASPPGAVAQDPESVEGQGAELKSSANGAGYLK